MAAKTTKKTVAKKASAKPAAASSTKASEEPAKAEAADQAEISATPDTTTAEQETPAPEAAQESGAGKDQADETKDKPKSPKGALRVTCHRAGFRRAGRAWEAGVTEVAADELDEAQIAALQDDPAFEVELL
jgi:hypothetical protein